jgi:hypothetical protein
MVNRPYYRTYKYDREENKKYHGTLSSSKKYYGSSGMVAHTEMYVTLICI